MGANVPLTADGKFCKLPYITNNLIKMKSTHLLPLFYWFCDATNEKNKKRLSKCRDLILIKLHYHYNEINIKMSFD